MKGKKIVTTIIGVTLLIGLTAGIASAAGETWKLVSAAADVLKVDSVKREITIKSPLGTVMTLSVDKRVERLKEIKAGDQIQVDYYVSLASEIREPTAEEKENPITVLETAAKAPPETRRKTPEKLSERG